MATIYYADAPNGDVGTATNMPIVVLEGGFDITVVFKFTLPDNSGNGSNTFLLSSAEAIALARIPAGARVLDYLINVPDLDGGSTLTLDLGLLTADENGFVAASTVGQAGGLVTPYNSPNGLVAGAVPSAEVGINSNAQLAEDALGDIFGLTVGTGNTAVTTATAALTGWVRYVLRGETVF